MRSRLAEDEKYSCLSNNGSTTHPSFEGNVFHRMGHEFFPRLSEDWYTLTIFSNYCRSTGCPRQYTSYSPTECGSKIIATFI
jgi:hypothetical protein